MLQTCIPASRLDQTLANYGIFRSILWLPQISGRFRIISRGFNPHDVDRFGASRFDVGF